MSQIVQLIRKNKTRLELCPEGVDALLKIDDFFSTCVCVGPYRLGKSYLLNRIMSMSDASNDVSFSIGHTDRSCTKGVWMTARPIHLTDDKGKQIKVLFFDTEVCKYFFSFFTNSI